MPVRGQSKAIKNGYLNIGDVINTDKKYINKVIKKINREIQNDDYKEHKLNSKTFITVVLASKGYPEKYEVGQLIQINNSNKLIFHAGTKYIDGNYIVSGGRVINVIGFGDSLKEAIDLVYRDVENISFTNMYYRSDIGRKGL